MRRVLDILLAVVMWAAVVAYVVFASDNAARRRADVRIDSLRIIVADADRCTTIDRDMVMDWVRGSDIKYKGQYLSNFDAEALQQYIAEKPFVRKAAVYTNLNGILTVEVTQRRPVARVMTENGYDFYLTDDAYILPSKVGEPVLVPLVTGAPPLMFKPGYFGDYEQIKEQLRIEYAEEVGKIDKQVDGVNKSMADTRAERAKTASKNAGRLWSSERKEKFDREKSAKLEELDNQTAEYERNLTTLAEQTTALQEKQKKSAKKYIFLYKLLNFVEFVGKDAFWSAQITQIAITGDEPTTAAVEIIPRAGNQTVCLGNIDAAAANLDKLMLFYRRGLEWQGWDNYKYIDLQYRNQIVCTK